MTAAVDNTQTLEWEDIHRQNMHTTSQKDGKISLNLGDDKQIHMEKTEQNTSEANINGNETI